MKAIVEAVKRTVLRVYQNDLKAGTYQKIAEGFKRILIVSGTGTGKTTTFCSITKDIVDNDVLGIHKRVAIIVHRKELLAQISLTLCREGITHNIVAPVSVARNIIALQRIEYKREFYHAQSRVSIISVDTLNSRADRYKDFINSVDILIIDEAAHVLADNKWGKAVKCFRSDVIVLGFTATPKRLDKKGLGVETDGIFEVMIEAPSTKWMIQNKFLSKYKIVVPPGDFESYLGHVKSVTSDFSQDQINNATEKSHIVGDVVKHYLKYAKGKQTILFAPTIGSAHKMEKEFLAAGIAAKLLTGTSTDRDRFDGVNDFKENKIQVLINVDLFDEGFDVPVVPGKNIVECVIMARPTMSLGKYLQVVGRGLRISPNKLFAILIDHVGNIKRHGFPDDERKWSLDRPERRPTNNTVRVCHICYSAYNRFEVVCPHCGAEAMKAERGGEGGGRIPPVFVDGDLELMDPDTLREMEEAAVLEHPDVTGNRVAAAAGMIAGKSAAKKQRARIESQTELKETIALWAGHKKAQGMTDRQIHKEFYLNYNKTIAEVLAEPKMQMDEYNEQIKGDL